MKELKWWGLPLVWVGVIFGFSSQSADEQEMEPFLSQYLPLETLRPFLEKIEFTYYHSTRSVEVMGLEPFVEFLIRKLAHFGVYFILALLIYVAVLKILDSKRFIQIAMTYFLLIHFAISDELSQSFSPGRTPYYGDVAIDAFGGLVGIFVALFFLYFKKERL
ncbi:VanZ family protein [Piscibacillus salipiscarius]|uniref:VanZ family protein n=1 Tax=Piscibacillus salipiscarius TaxID=299480 RepID=A0ABW5QAW8_9BACI